MKRRPKITEHRFDQWADDLKSWIQESVSPFEDDTPAKQRERIDRSRWDKLYFMQTYLPHYFYGEFGEFHDEWSDFGDIRDDVFFVARPARARQINVFYLRRSAARYLLRPAPLHFDCVRYQ